MKVSKINKDGSIGVTLPKFLREVGWIEGKQLGYAYDRKNNTITLYIKE